MVPPPRCRPGAPPITSPKAEPKSGPKVKPDAPKECVAEDRAPPSKDARDTARAKASADPIAGSKRHLAHKAFDADYPPSPAELQGDRRYQRLPAATQKEVLKSLDAAKDGDSRNNISRLTINDGFAKLSPEDQKRMLEIQRKNPTYGELSESLNGLASSAKFRDLPDASRKAILDGVERNVTMPGAAKTLQRLADQPGYSNMPPDEQVKLANLLGGTTSRSIDERAKFEEVAKAENLKGMTPAEQGRYWSAFLTVSPGAPRATTGGPDDFKDKAAPYTIGEARIGKDGTKTYDVTFDKQTIPVTVREPKDKSLKTPSIEELAHSLAVCPEASRRTIKTVEYQREPDKDGAYMASYGAAGRVLVYPGKEQKPPSFVDSAMIHESGHTLSGTRWGDDTKGPSWDRWKQAIDKDKVIPSTYCRDGAPLADDFSESLLLYRRVKGTPEEVEYRRLFPERFAVLDEVTR